MGKTFKKRHPDEKEDKTLFNKMFKSKERTLNKQSKKEKRSK